MIADTIRRMALMAEDYSECMASLNKCAAKIFFASLGLGRKTKSTVAGLALIASSLVVAGVNGPVSAATTLDMSGTPLKFV